MSESRAERLVTAFARGLMLGLLGAQEQSPRSSSRRSVTQSVPAAPSHMQEPEDLLAAAHEALRTIGQEPEQLDLEMVAEAMQRKREMEAALDAVHTQPGPGEQEVQTWTGVG